MKAGGAFTVGSAGVVMGPDGRFATLSGDRDRSRDSWPFTLGKGPRSSEDRSRTDA